jgi:hypothetical protein
LTTIWNEKGSNSHLEDNVKGINGCRVLAYEYRNDHIPRIPIRKFPSVDVIKRSVIRRYELGDRLNTINNCIMESWNNESWVNYMIVVFIYIRTGNIATKKLSWSINTIIIRILVRCIRCRNRYRICSCDQ